MYYLVYYHFQHQSFISLGEVRYGKGICTPWISPLTSFAPPTYKLCFLKGTCVEIFDNRYIFIFTYLFSFIL